MLNDALSALLLVLFLGGLVLEAKAPGLGIAGVVGLAAGVLLFGPRLANGDTHWWELAAIGAGLLLLALELFVTPGFGVLGVAGLLVLVAGLTAALLGNSGTDFSGLTAAQVAQTAGMVVSLMVLSVVLTLWLAQRIIQSPLAHPLAHSQSMDGGQGYTAHNMGLRQWIGHEGVLDTDLRPTGNLLLNGAAFEARSQRAFLTRGTRVKVVALDGNTLVVEPLPA